MSYANVLGFDADKYLQEQSRFITERAERYDKLYLEVGGKLLDDLHAMRVLPGFVPDMKMRVLQKMQDRCEVIICIYAQDIEENKIRGDYGITYDADVFRMIDEFLRHGLKLAGVVITRYAEQPQSKIFIQRLERRGIRVYTHGATQGYPTDIDTICSDEGYGKNSYIETERPIVVITAPGPNSGKLATALCQLYHDTKKGLNAGYSKFETFPIWNLPLKHPVNIAYEAATADLQDVNMIDPYHLEACNENSVNYNRDVEAYPLLRRILTRIRGRESEYRSPTEMGVNRAGFAIIDDEICRQAAIQEIIRRYFQVLINYKLGLGSEKTVTRCKLLMEDLNLSEDMRAAIEPARDYQRRLQALDETTDLRPCAAIELPDGRIVTGRQSTTMTAVSAMLLNALKAIAGIDDALHLLSPVVLEPMLDLKGAKLHQSEEPLDAKEVLMALAVSASTNTTSALAMTALPGLFSSQVHCTSIPSKSDKRILSRLGIDCSADPYLSSTKIYFEL
ncbi:MAG: DUF1846 domain-containing protein [Eubacteriales bacterium]|nr:DUF1846 domain-containing protein [Eubacteriales bacterium]